MSKLATKKNPYLCEDFSNKINDPEFVKEVEAQSDARRQFAMNKNNSKGNKDTVLNFKQINTNADNKRNNIFDLVDIKKIDQTKEDILVDKYGDSLHNLSKSVAKLESTLAVYKILYDNSQRSIRCLRSTCSKPDSNSPHVVTPTRKFLRSVSVPDLGIGIEDVVKNGGRNSKKTNSKSKKSLKHTSNRKRKSSYNKTHKRT